MEIDNKSAEIYYKETIKRKKEATKILKNLNIESIYDKKNEYKSFNQFSTSYVKIISGLRVKLL